MPLTTEERAAFLANGAIIKRGFVRPDLIGRAATLISDWYEQELDQAQLTAYTQRTFAPELGDHPDLLALFAESGAADLAGCLLGEFAPVHTVQIQIRVPQARLIQVQPEKGMHVDGVACPHLDPAELRTFSLLVGVVLSEITDAAGGALRYVPGGHLQMADWFSREWRRGVTEQVPPHIDAEDGTAFLGAPGDLLLMHHLVPHAAGDNHTATPRVMAYFRVSQVDHASRRLDSLRHPWLAYPALAAAGSR